MLASSSLVGCPAAPVGDPGAARAVSGGPATGAAGPEGGGTSPEAGIAAGISEGSLSDEGGAGPTGGGGVGETADTPITVSGSPLGSIPGPHCAPTGTRIYFEDVRTAVTGQKDELGRNVIQVKGLLYAQQGANPPDGLGDKLVAFFDLVPSEKAIGTTATWNGCFFAKVQAHESAVGRVIRLKSDLFVCTPASDLMADEAGRAVMMKKSDSPSTLATAVYDLTLPARTEEAALDPCPGAPPSGRPQGISVEETLNRELKRRNKR